MIDPAKVVIPERLKDFPLYKGRYLVHYTVYVDPDGKPDFRVVDEANRMNALTYDLCHLCGQTLDRPVVFIGGPLCAENLVFMDGPMHEECALYSVKVCPYLANPHHGDEAKQLARGEATVNKHADTEGVKIKTNEDMQAGRPARMALIYAERYFCGRTPSGTIVVIARDVIKTDFTTIPQAKP